MTSVISGDSCPARGTTATSSRSLPEPPSTRPHSWVCTPSAYPESRRRTCRRLTCSKVWPFWNPATGMAHMPSRKRTRATWVRGCTASSIWSSRTRRNSMYWYRRAGRSFPGMSAAASEIAALRAALTSPREIAPRTPRFPSLVRLASAGAPSLKVASTTEQRERR